MTEERLAGLEARYRALQGGADDEAARLGGVVEELGSAMRELEGALVEACRKARIAGELEVAEERAEEVVALRKRLMELASDGVEREGGKGKMMAAAAQEHLASGYYTWGTVVRLRLATAETGKSRASPRGDAEKRLVLAKDLLEKSLEMRRALLMGALERLGREHVTSFSENGELQRLRLQTGQSLAAISILEQNHGGDGSEEPWESEALNLFACLPLETREEVWFYDAETRQWYIKKKPESVGDKKANGGTAPARTGWRAKFSFKFSRTRTPSSTAKSFSQPAPPPSPTSSGSSPTSPFVSVAPSAQLLSIQEKPPSTHSRNRSEASSTSENSARKSSSCTDDDAPLALDDGDARWRLVASAPENGRIHDDLPPVIHMNCAKSDKYLFGREDMRTSKQQQLYLKHRTRFVKFKYAHTCAKRHAEMSFSQTHNAWFLKDIADYGTLVNGVRVRHVKLREGDTIVFGGVHQIKFGDSNYGDPFAFSRHVYKLEKLYDTSPGVLVPPGLFLSDPAKDQAYHHFHALVMTEYLRKHMLPDAGACAFDMNEFDTALLYQQLCDKKVPLQYWMRWIQTQIP